MSAFFLSIRVFLSTHFLQMLVCPSLKMLLNINLQILLKYKLHLQMYYLLESVLPTNAYAGGF